MKILIISHYFPPMNSIASLRPYSWAKHWTNAGHVVTVLTTKKHPDSTDLGLDVSRFKILEYSNLYSLFFKFRRDVQKLGSEKKTSFGLFKRFHDSLKKVGAFTWDARMPNMLSSGKRAALKLVDEPWDLVVSTFAPYSTHWIACRLKVSQKAKRWIADYRDLWTKSQLYTGFFPFTLMEKSLEKKFNTIADVVTTVSEPLTNLLAVNGGGRRYCTIENGFDNDDISSLPQERLWSDGKVRIAYTGSIYTGFSDPSPMFQAIEKIMKSKDEKLLSMLEVIFVGNRQGNLEKLIKKHMINRYVKNLGFVERQKALQIQRDADVLLFLDHDDGVSDGIMTGKLFEYLASGTMIWAIGKRQSTSASLLIEDCGGKSFGSHVDSIAEAILELLRGNPNQGMSAGPILAKYSRKYLAQKMLSLVE